MDSAIHFSEMEILSNTIYALCEYQYCCVSRLLHVRNLSLDQTPVIGSSCDTFCMHILKMFNCAKVIISFWLKYIWLTTLKFTLSSMKSLCDMVLMLLCWLTVNRKCKQHWKNTRHLSENQSFCSLWILRRQPARLNTKWKMRQPCGRKYTPIQNCTSKSFSI